MKANNTMSEEDTMASIKCPSCGNTHRFMQVMAEQVNLVNGTGKHIRQIEAVIDRYICWQCGESFPFGESDQDERTAGR